MPERVTVQLESPNGSSAGAITEGFYVVEGNRLTMTFANGAPVMVDGERVERLMTPTDDPRKIAGMLTREVRRALSGQNEAQEAFGRSIQYPGAGLA